MCAAKKMAASKPGTASRMAVSSWGDYAVKLYHQQPLAQSSAKKGWYVGPWNESFPFPVGYAEEGVDEPHLHRTVTEVYLIARGTAELRIERDTVTLHAGDMVIVEPGEAHTFISNSPDYFHFVFHYPGLLPEQAKEDKQLVSRDRLGP
jgi:mannose-6-phosphate isomerase-like protein (cupin superfamily)